MRRRLVCIAVALLMICLSAAPLAACGRPDEQETAGDLYSFEAYASEDVFDIEPMQPGESFAGVCEFYKFRFLSDGYGIEGYISIPKAAAESNEPSKCVLFCRGGNARIGAMDTSFIPAISALSGRVAIAAELRGAGNSGGEDRFGGDDLHDVIKLIDLCEKSFSFVNMDDFCVAGISRGGMMAYMAAREDGRVKRLIAISALSDLFDAYDYREDMRDMLESSIGCAPEEDPAEYEKRSPVRWCDEIKIPVLIIHSTGDKRVPYSQAQEMYDKLKDNVECKFVVNDDDSHGVIHDTDKQIIHDWLNQ